LGFDLFLTIEECFYGPLLLFGLMRIKGVFDGSHSDVQRHTALFPALDQSPIHRTEHEMLAAPANEGVLYF